MKHNKPFQERLARLDIQIGAALDLGKGFGSHTTLGQEEIKRYSELLAERCKLIAKAAGTMPPVPTRDRTGATFVRRLVEWDEDTATLMDEWGYSRFRFRMDTGNPVNPGHYTRIPEFFLLTLRNLVEDLRSAEVAKEKAGQ